MKNYLQFTDFRAEERRLPVRTRRDDQEALQENTRSTRRWSPHMAMMSRGQTAHAREFEPACTRCGSVVNLTTATASSAAPSRSRTAPGDQPDGRHRFTLMIRTYEQAKIDGLRANSRCRDQWP